MTLTRRERTRLRAALNDALDAAARTQLPDPDRLTRLRERVVGEVEAMLAARAGAAGA